MKDVVLFDLGETLVRYFKRDDFPDILNRAILEVHSFLIQRGLIGVSMEDIWPRVRGEDYESKNHRFRPLRSGSRIFFDSQDPLFQGIS